VNHREEKVKVTEKLCQPMSLHFTLLPQIVNNDTKENRATKDKSLVLNCFMAKTVRSKAMNIRDEMVFDAQTT
jgi:hypothetical protein